MTDKRVNHHRLSPYQPRTGIIGEEMAAHKRDLLPDNLCARHRRRASERVVCKIYFEPEAGGGALQENLGPA